MSAEPRGPITWWRAAGFAGLWLMAFIVLGVCCYLLAGYLEGIGFYHYLDPPYQQMGGLRTLVSLVLAVLVLALFLAAWMVHRSWKVELLMAVFPVALVAASFTVESLVLAFVGK